MAPARIRSKKVKRKVNPFELMRFASNIYKAPKKIFSCSYCLRRFGNQGALATHKSYTHVRESMSVAADPKIERRGRSVNEPADAQREFFGTVLQGKRYFTGLKKADRGGCFGMSKHNSRRQVY